MCVIEEISEEIRLFLELNESWDIVYYVFVIDFIYLIGEFIIISDFKSIL